MLYITINSFKHQSLVYVQSNDQTVLFQTIQFSINQQSWMVPIIAIHHQQFNLTSVIRLHIVKGSNTTISNNLLIVKH